MGELNNVNHPSHYNREGSMECIDEMILIFGKNAVMNFCLCNAWKYRYRAADKNGAEDLAKSDWYLHKYKELKEERHQIKYNVENILTTNITPWSVPCNYGEVTSDIMEKNLKENYWTINGKIERSPK